MSRVALVLIKDFRDSLQKLAFRMPVWLLETAENRLAAAEAVRMSEEWPQIDVTIFTGMPKDREEWIDRVKSMELNRRITSLEVIGSEMTLHIRAALTELGFDKFESTPEGFRARRPR